LVALNDQHSTGLFNHKQSAAFVRGFAEPDRTLKGDIGVNRSKGNLWDFSRAVKNSREEDYCEKKRA
jgi:hypothetical protein